MDMFDSYIGRNTVILNEKYLKKKEKKIEKYKTFKRPKN